MENGFALVDSVRIKKICDYFVETYEYKANRRIDYINHLKYQVLRTNWLGKAYTKSDELNACWLGVTAYLIEDGLSEDIARIEQHLPVVQSVINLLRIGKKLYLTDEQCKVLYQIEKSMPTNE